MLVDDDPFAFFSRVPQPSAVVVSPPAHVPRATLTRPRSSGHGQVRPAYTKPAFTPRPSLPSLHTLARMNTSGPVRKSKVRKGTPGARLPHEPWDMDLTAELNFLTRTSGATRNSETCLVSSETALDSPSLPDETSSSRPSSGDDVDSLPSLSYTPSEPSSSAFSRSSSIESSSSIAIMDCHEQASVTHNVDDTMTGEDDPLSYHSDFDYYIQSLSDQSDPEPDVDPTSGGSATHHFPLDVGITPYPSAHLADFRPETPTDTMRRSSVHRERTQNDTRTLGSPDMEASQGDGERRGQKSDPARQNDREEEARGRMVIKSNGGHSGGKFFGAYGGRRSSASSTSHSTSSSEDDADGITVYYSLDGISNGPPSRSHSRTHLRRSKAGGGSDDDVPLAQRVPTALSAQKSIRKQLRDERQQRKLERAKSSRTATNPPLPVRPTGSSRAPGASTSSRRRSMSAAPAPVPASRAVPAEPFPVEDLTRKLASLQTSSRTPPLTAPPISTKHSPRVPGHNGGLSRSSSRGRHTDHPPYLQQKTPRVLEASSQDKPLRSMRSFHRSDGWHSETQRSPFEQTSVARLGRSATAGRTVRAGRDTTGYEQHTKSGRVSEDGRKPSASIPRPSMDRESDAAQRTVQRPPVPPLPISDPTPPQHMTRVPVVQQRIFIGDMQRFNIVEITPATNAGDVINTVASQGMLDRSGSWMLFEMAQDYGMERPVRDYELLADVSASWNKNKLLNAFVIKQTPLAQLLGRSAIPTSSPTHRGWVEWESKRGKWSKRWMELREHGIWLSKRDTGKDEVLLCSLSNFDAYCVTRRHKSPKAFVFAVKSTDHLSLFENASDYLHVFSCNPKDGEKWMQVILVARSYVLYQERHVLFAKTGELLSQAKPLTRSRTRKQSVSNRPAQPLVNVPPPFSQAPSANVAFEPGSLLAKRKVDTALPSV